MRARGRARVYTALKSSYTLSTVLIPLCGLYSIYSNPHLFWGPITLRIIYKRQ